jgi:hypothetical protein
MLIYISLTFKKKKQTNLQIKASFGIIKRENWCLMQFFNDSEFNLY